MRDDSIRDVEGDVPYVCSFGHGYKKGSVWNRPLRYFSQPRDIRTSQSRCATQGRHPLQLPSRAWLKKGRFGTDPYNIFHEHRSSALYKLGVLQFFLIGKSFTEKSHPFGTERVTFVMLQEIPGIGISTFLDHC